MSDTDRDGIDSQNHQDGSGSNVGANRDYDSGQFNDGFVGNSRNADSDSGVPTYGNNAYDEGYKGNILWLIIFIFNIFNL